jgi:hypothetical protein
MRYYLLGSAENYNEIRFKKVEDLQRYIGLGSAIGDKWEAPNLEYIYGVNSSRDKNFDVSQVCNPLITFSRKAVEILGKELVRYGELLEINSPKGFVFFHCTNIIDALDEDKSEVVWLNEDKGWISRINKFSLNEGKIRKALIFRLPNANYRYTFFSENFRNLYEENNLKGVDFDRFEKIEVS